MYMLLQHTTPKRNFDGQRHWQIHGDSHGPRPKLPQCAVFGGEHQVGIGLEQALQAPAPGLAMAPFSRGHGL
jgi:hypothetical protein